MRMPINEVQAEFKNSGSADLGWFLTLYNPYGNEKKFWEQIKTDHLIVNMLIKCIEEDGYRLDEFIEMLHKAAETNPLIKEILSGYVKITPHVSGDFKTGLYMAEGNWNEQH